MFTHPKLNQSSPNLFQQSSLLKQFSSSSKLYQSTLRSLRKKYADLLPYLIECSLDEFLLDPQIIEKRFIQPLFIKMKSAGSLLKMMRKSKQKTDNLQKKIRKQREVIKQMFRFEQKLKRLTLIQGRRGKDIVNLQDDLQKLLSVDLRHKPIKQSLRYIDKLQEQVSIIKRGLMQQRKIQSRLCHQQVYLPAKEKDTLQNALLGLQSDYQSSSSAADVKRAQQLAFLQMILRADFKTSKAPSIMDTSNELQEVNYVAEESDKSRQPDNITQKEEPKKEEPKKEEQMAQFYQHCYPQYMMMPVQTPIMMYPQGIPFMQGVSGMPCMPYTPGMPSISYPPGMPTYWPYQMMTHLQPIPMMQTMVPIQVQAYKK